MIFGSSSNLINCPLDFLIFPCILRFSFMFIFIGIITNFLDFLSNSKSQHVHQSFPILFTSVFL
jgi:hypothetical protein